MKPQAWARARWTRGAAILAAHDSTRATLFLSVALVLTLLCPLLVLAVRGTSLAAFTEESTGYRYYHSLRILYGDHERPWLPQAQGVGLTHFAIQLLLAAVGLPPTLLRPRIDLFAYMATALPLVTTGIVFAWAVKPRLG